MADKLRRVLVLVVAGFLYYSGLLGVWRFFRRVILRRREVCVLALHRVLSEEEESQANSLPGMVLREATFASMLEFLKREFHVVPLQVFLLGTEADHGDSRPWCLVSFDEGWSDNYSTAHLWLKKYSIPATIFLTTGMLGTSSVFWVEQLVRAWKDPPRRQQIQARFREARQGGQPPALEEIVEFCKRMPADERRRFLCNLALPLGAQGTQYPADLMLTWDQVREMSSNGIDFGSHTVTHPLLTYENDVAVQHELTASKQALEERLGKEVQAFAYPNGDWNERVREMVKDAGYQVAFTTQRGWYRAGQDPYAIPRIMLHEGNVTGLNGRFSRAVLSLRLSGLY